MDLIARRVRHESANPPVIPTRKFYQKIKKVAREVGISNPQVYEWDRSLTKSWFSDGCLREARLQEREMSHDHDKDIGYLKRNDDGKYTVHSFKINARVFSNGLYRRFQEVLEEHGLKPSAHHCLGTVFSTEAEVRARRTREPLYK